METKDRLGLSRRQALVTAGKSLIGFALVTVSGVIGAGCGGAGSSPSIPSAPGLTDDQTRMLKLNSTNEQQLAALIAEVEPHLVRNADGTVTLPTTRAANLSDEATQFAGPVLSKLNEMVRAGKVSVDEQLNVRPTDAQVVSTTRAQNQNSFNWCWWGFQWYLNNQRTGILTTVLDQGLINPAADYLKTWAAIRYGWAAGFIVTIAAILIVWGAVIDWVNYKGGNKGVRINVTWATVVVVQAQPFV